MPGIELSVDQRAVQRVRQAMRVEEDGKALRKELVVDLKRAVAPGVSAVAGRLSGLPSRSSTPSSPPLGSYLASRVKPQVRLGGRSTGVAVRIAQTPNLRGFKKAARWLNRQSWRHKVFGNAEVWVTQQSPIPGFFDETLSKGKEDYRKAVVAALEAMARRITERA